MGCERSPVYVVVAEFDRAAALAAGDVLPLLEPLLHTRREGYSRACIAARDGSRAVSVAESDGFEQMRAAHTGRRQGAGRGIWRG